MLEILSHSLRRASCLDPLRPTTAQHTTGETFRGTLATYNNWRIRR